MESIFGDVAIGPQQVHKVLGRHVLDDGYKLVYDTRASHGSWIVDARSGEEYLDMLWEAESSWNVSAENPSTGAFGIPQAVPGSKMSAAGLDWQTNAATQIRWGLGYISAAYGSPRGAWEHEVTYGWY